MSLFSRIGKSITGAVTHAASDVASIFTGNRGGSGVVSRPPPPQRTITVSDNISLVRDFSDVILRYDDTQDYTDKAVRCANYVKRPVKDLKWNRPAPPRPPTKQYRDFEIIDRQAGRNQNNGLRIAYRPDKNEHPWVSVLRPQIYDVPDVAKTSRGSTARVNLFGFMEEVLSFSSQAKNAGFSPPDNPFVEISRLNALRNKMNVEVQVSEQDASDLIYNIQAYVDLLEAQAAGAINLQSGVFNAAQLEHVTLSYSGLGGTGNNVADLMRLLPDADELKSKKAHDALSVLNFSKRLPHVVFVCEYNPVGNKEIGSIIGWKRIADAAGYIVKRHSVMSNEDVEFEVSNNDVIQNNDKLMDYVKTYVMTFYDKIKPEGVCLFLDKNPPQNEYCIYRVQAYQLKKESSTSIIPSNFVSMNLTGLQKLSITKRIRELDPADIDQLGEETISPWPVIAEQVLNDANVDWILAASNIRNAIDTKEEKTISRKYSYLNSHVKFLLERSDAGKLVRPESIDAVRDAVANAIQTYGVSQTIEALLQETGVLYYFDGRDGREDTVFDRAGTQDVTTSGVIGAVVSAIDPESATIDLKSLATNLASILSDGKLEDYTTTLEMAAKKAEGAKPTEIEIASSFSNDSAEAGIQFVANLGEASETSVDLTTFDGISKMMRVIRVMSDFGPNRIPPKIPVAVPVVQPVVEEKPAQEEVRDNQESDRRELPTAGQARQARKEALAERLDNIRNTGSSRRRYEP